MVLPYLPIPCVLIRNLILSAFPRNMKMPDPFLPNLLVDLLLEIKVVLRILANYTSTLLQLHLAAMTLQLWALTASFLRLLSTGWM